MHCIKHVLFRMKHKCTRKSILYPECKFPSHITPNRKLYLLCWLKLKNPRTFVKNQMHKNLASSQCQVLLNIESPPHIPQVTHIRPIKQCQFQHCNGGCPSKFQHQARHQKHKNQLVMHNLQQTKPNKQKKKKVKGTTPIITSSCCT